MEAAPDSPATSAAGALGQGDLAAAYRAAASGPEGLTATEATARRARLGPNTVARVQRSESLRLLARQFSSPIVLILAVATVLSGLLGDLVDALIILAIISVSGLLGFWQERAANRAVATLLATVRVEAEVLRDGHVASVPVEDIVPGDVVLLNAGDVVPGDGVVIASRTLLVDESALTGESYPAEKLAAAGPAAGSAGSAGPPGSARAHAVFMGTHVLSGSGNVLIVRTGAATEFGAIAARIGQPEIETGFERGMTAFGRLLLRTMVVLVVAIFLINLALARPLVDSALFSLALAVGLTPQLLPAIVVISLSQGARQMARQRVIVKRLDAIEDFGAMTILCTDKTGTMTLGSVSLQGALDVEGNPSPRVHRLAYLNALYQAGFENPIDAAVLAADNVDATGIRLLDELPYDFSRKRLSVLVEDGTSTLMITKGAYEQIQAVCTDAEGRDGGRVALGPILPGVARRVDGMSARGLRVLGVAIRQVDRERRLKAADEAGMTLVGLLAFVDPPKPGADETVRALADAGVSVRMITGDNRLVADQVGRQVGLPLTEVMTGSDVDRLDDAGLAKRSSQVGVFAEVDPAHKERIIRSLRAAGHVVGYLGDGINDAPALHAADVGISVDSAVDVAKESAAIVLLDKDLRVLLDGVRQGRRTFANTMKYVFATTSANFGNMLSMAIAAVVLPFLPLLAGQILLINLLTDIPATTIATDDVDPEQLESPHSWDITLVRDFMLVFGGVSSVFDLMTFAVLRVAFGADAVLFRSGWFVESVATELAVLFVLRTRRPFFGSRPSPMLVVSSLGVAAVTLAIPFTPLGGLLGLDALPGSVVVALLAIAALYVAATELAKQVFYRHRSPRLVLSSHEG